MWIDFRAESRTPVTGTALPDDLLSTFRGTSGASTENFTVVRTIIHFSFGETSSNAASFNDQCDLGLIVASTGASGGRVPVPTTETLVDWMWLQHRHPLMDAQYARASTGVTNPESQALGHWHIDTPVMRKITDVGMSLFLNNIWTVATAGAWSYSLHARILVKLP